MALQRATRTGGDFLDLKELAAEGDVLAVFRIVEFHEPEKATGFEAINLPVTADLLVCSGPREEEVHLAERFIGAITSTLRGVRNPRAAKGEQPQPPETKVGDEIAVRIKVVNPGKANAYAAGDVPSDAEYAAIEKFHADGAAWNVEPANARPQLATAGASSSGASKRPW